MADVKLVYGTSTALTCTLANLETGASRTSDAQDNSSSLYLDASVTVLLGIATGAGVTGNSNAVYVYFYGSEDGTHFTDNTTSVDAAITLRTPNSLFGPYVASFPTATAGPYNVATVASVASYFGGVLPRKWGIVVQNKTNSNLTTGANMTATFTPIYATVT